MKSIKETSSLKLFTCLKILDSQLKFYFPTITSKPTGTSTNFARRFFLLFYSLTKANHPNHDV